MAGGVTDMDGAVHGGPRQLLRLEGLALLAGAVLAYRALGAGWGAFAALFLLPDLALLAYGLGPRWGARAYNLTHSTLAAAMLLGGAWWVGAQPSMALALVWLAHIGFDRALGYGLKYERGFGDSHLGRVGLGRSVRAERA